MATAFRPRTLILFVGDIIFWTLALWLSLYARVLQVPSLQLFEQHMVPFSMLFVAWALVYFIAGLYESRSIILARRALSASLLVSQTFNMMLAALFFFVVPAFGIAPKTLLLIYLVISFVLVLFWRVFLFPRLGFAKPEAAVLIGEGREIMSLAQALQEAPHAPTHIAATISPAEPDLTRATVASMEAHRARVIIADFDDERVAAAFPHMYNLLAAGVRFVDALELYEELFGRVPLSRLNSAWLARNISRDAHLLYDPFKRLMDIVASLVFGIISLVFYPFIIIALKMQDGGAIFYRQVRVGQNNRPLPMVKFRSMSGADSGSEVLKSKLVVTKVGRVLRASRIDEVPQLWSVFMGEMSLIGPRPEFPALVAEYAREIPYYNLRHLVKPGISGWAQLYHHADPHHATDVEETRNKLSYDLYYLKHRSLLLDFTIALKTVRRILMRGNA